MGQHATNLLAERIRFDKLTQMTAIGQKRTPIDPDHYAIFNLRSVVSLLKPTLELRVHFAFLFDSHTMTHHRIEAAGFL